MTPRPAFAVVVDADLCLPPALAGLPGILVAPSDAPLLVTRENIPRLSLEAGGALDPQPAIAACIGAVDDGASAVVYVPAGDGYGAPEGVAEPVREALAARGVAFEVLETGEGAMAAGWRAVLLAEALAAGHTLAVALERSHPAEAGALALVEHPELASIAGPDGGSTTQRLLVRIVGPEFRLISSPSRRDDGLRALRDRFATETEGVTGRLRVAVMYGGVEPAGDAMATWIRRHRPEADVHAAAITRHQGTRLGPGFVGIAWAVETSAG